MQRTQLIPRIFTAGKHHATVRQIYLISRILLLGTQRNLPTTHKIAGRATLQTPDQNWPKNIR